MNHPIGYLVEQIDNILQGLNLKKTNVSLIVKRLDMILKSHNILWTVIKHVIMKKTTISDVEFS